ncbi:MAG: hydrogenase maturation protease [Bdellovibrionales bacterium]|nr:hydrogenase maturation protease [Bdellovibrionales bacterium]
MLTHKALICLANPNRGDDAFGWIVADQFVSEGETLFSVIKSSGDITDLLDVFGSYRKVIVLDAMETEDLVPIKKWDAKEESLPASLSGTSSHVLGVGQAIELSRALDKIPDELIVIGVKGVNFQMGEELSPGMRSMIPEIIAYIRKEFAEI